MDLDKCMLDRLAVKGLEFASGPYRWLTDAYEALQQTAANDADGCYTVAYFIPDGPRVVARYR